NDEQLVKLRTLGMTEEEAEGVIIENFLNYNMLKIQVEHP
ncbi:SufD family Fe-S cluster assembly protein, partial [Blautia faecis]